MNVKEGTCKIMKGTKSQIWKMQKTSPKMIRNIAKINDNIKSEEKKKPLNISKKSVKAAAFLFPLRRMLVAPIFFEPNVRGSWILKKNFPTKPNGIDPIR